MSTEFKAPLEGNIKLLSACKITAKGTVMTNDSKLLKVNFVPDTLHASFYLLFMLDTIIPTVQTRKLRLTGLKQLWSQDLKSSSVSPELIIYLLPKRNERRVHHFYCGYSKGLLLSGE